MNLHYATLPTEELQMLAGEKGLERLSSREQLISALLAVDREAESLSQTYKQRGKTLEGTTLVLCHGRAQVRILNIDYENAVFVDIDRDVLPDIFADYQRLKLNTLFDNIVMSYCPVPGKNDFSCLKYLKDTGEFFISEYKDPYVYSNVRANGFVYNRTVYFDTFTVEAIYSNKYLAFVPDQSW